MTKTTKQHRAEIIAKIITECARHFRSSPLAILTSDTKARHPDHMARMAAWTHLEEQGMTRLQMSKIFHKTPQAVGNGIRKAFFRDMLVDHQAFMATLPALPKTETHHA